MGDSQATDASAGQRTKSLIFIVDDEPILLELASSILSAAGYDCKTFTDPAQALREFTAARPPLVITDYAMGSLSGTDLIRECRRLSPRQKIILLSGTADESVFANVPDKPDYFMAKPYSPGQLVALVKTVLGN